MMTTVAADGALRSRPLLLESLEPDGSLVFLTHLSSQKIGELSHDARVNVAFVSGKGDRYISVSGTGKATHDPGRMHAMWNPT
jgi:general stress protein 26